MSEFDQKRKVRRILLSPAVLVFMVVILFFVARGAWNIYLKDRVSVVELYSSQERLAKLQARRAVLETATAKLSTESGIEYEIRDRFQMAKAGERQIVIIDSASTSNQIVPVSRNFLQKIWDFFTIR